MAEPSFPDRVVRVLLVDDDEDEYVLIRDLLEEQPYLAGDRRLRFHVDWVDQYEAALQACFGSRHDVFLFDYYLGANTGLELLRSVKEAGSRAPVIILTGRGDARVDLAAMQGGADDYLLKDALTGPVLERAIRYAIERRAAQEALERSREDLERRVAGRTRELAETNQRLRREIEERRRAEAALRQAKAELEDRVAQRTAELRGANRRLTAVLQTQPAAVWITDSSGRVQRSNRMAEELWGVGEGEIQHVSDFARFQAWWSDSGEPLGPDDWALARALARGETSIGETIDIKRAGGELRTILASAAPIRSAEGQIVGAVSVSQDITRQRALERQAHHRAEELDKVFGAMTDAVMVFNDEGRLVRANQASVELLGFDPLEDSGEDSLARLDIRYPDGRPAPVEALPSTRAARGEVVARERYLLRTASGRDVLIVASAAPLYGAKGRQTGALLLWRDVTEREDLLHRLEIEQARLQAIIEYAPEGIVLVDRQARILMANPAAGRLFQRPIPVGEPFESHAVFSFAYPDGTLYDPRNLPLTRSALDGEYIEDLEMLISWPDGQQRVLLANTAPIRDSEGELNGAIGLFQEITARKQAEERMRLSAMRSSVLAEVARAFSENGKDYRTPLRQITEILTVSLAGAAFICLEDPGSGRLAVAACSHKDPRLRAELVDALSGVEFEAGDLVGRVFHSEESVLMPFVPQSELRAMSPEPLRPFLDRHPVRSLLVAPVRGHRGRLGALGVLRFERRQPFNAEDKSFLEDLAYRTALAIENARLHQAQAERARQLDALQTATAALLTTLDLENLLGHILDAAIRAIPAAERGVLLLTAPETGRLTMRASLGFSDPRIRRESLARMAAYAAEAVKNRRSQRVDDLLALYGPAAGTGKLKSREAVRSVIAVPLVKNEEALGVLALQASRVGAFTENDLRLLESFAHTTTTAIHNATLHREVQRQALTDPLTGLYNRRGFFELGRREIDRLRRFQHPLTIIMLDLDHFKQVNDTHGHAVGDQVLCGLSERLGANLREVDILGRYGGEEFAILLPETDLPTGVRIADRLREAVAEESFPTDAGPLSLTISLGVGKADSKVDLEGLIKRADRALYAAKERGRDRVEVA